MRHKKEAYFEVIYNLSKKLAKYVFDQFVLLMIK